MNPTDPTSIPSRRHVVKMGAGMLAAPAILSAAGTVLGRPEEQAPPTTNPQGLENPRTQYATPPYPAQHQDPPGLVSKMDPRPDHGEQSYRGSGRLLGRRALITGGDSGMGRAAAIAFAREGADVAIGHLPVEEPDAREAIELIQAAGRKAVSLPGDIRDESFCQKLVTDAVDQLGGLDILVNNAGAQMPHPSIEQLSTEQFDSVFKTNVYAMFWITKAALPHLQPGSAIINTASIQAFDPSATLLDYAQTKACIVVFTKVMAKQLASRGIRVNAVAPGPVWTPLIVSTFSEKSVTKFGADSPLGRAAQPVELSPVYVLLASNEASYTTGEVYFITGGQSPV